MNFIIVLLLLISQFLIVPTSFRWIKEAGAQLLIVLAIASLIWKKNKPLSLFLIWSLFLFILQKAYRVNDGGQEVTYQISLLSFFSMLNIILYGIFYYVLHEIQLNKKLIYKTFCFIAVFQSVYVIIQSLNLDQFFFHLSGLTTGVAKKGWPVGLWGNETLCSWCIALCAPFFLAFKEFRYKVGYFLSGMGIWLTGGRIALFAYIVSFLFWLFFSGKRKTSIVLSLIVLVSGIFLYQHNYIEHADPHRIEVWKESLTIWKERTITGHGHGAFKALVQPRLPQHLQLDGHWAQAHNDYIQILFEQGLIGFGIFLSLIWITIYRFWMKKAGLVPLLSLLSFAIIATYGFPLRTSQGVLVILSLVLFEKEAKRWQEIST